MFLDELDRLSAGKLSATILSELDQTYQVSQSGNVEILMRWYQLCLHNDYEPAFAGAALFATQHGRMKYCRPIYK
jgi:leukotriene-A4 hydrolase